MIPSAIRVFPLSKTSEPEEFGTIEKAYSFFRNLPSRYPPGRFNIPTEKSRFKKGSMILFQYAERKNEEKIIGHSILLSEGCVPDNSYRGYIGYYLFDKTVIYKTPLTKEEIYSLWRKTLFQSKLDLDVTKYSEYMSLLKSKGN